MIQIPIPPHLEGIAHNINQEKAIGGGRDLPDGYGQKADKYAFCGDTERK